MVNTLAGIDIGELARIVKGYGAYFGGAVGFPIAFRDRELEVGRLVDRLVGVRVVYGPLGCGKSTLLMNLARALSEVRSDVIVIYVNFEEKGFMNAVRAYIPGLAGGVGDSIIRAVERDLGPVLDRVGLGAVVGVGRLFMDIIRGVSDDAVIRDKYVVLIFDELDKWYRSMLNAPDNAQVGYGPIEGEVMSYAEHFENFPTMDKVQGLSVVFGFSDQGAVNVVRKYGGKGLLEGLLLWYIPKADFMDVLNEVTTKAKPSTSIDTELLWQLTGGNLRELARIVFNNDWSIEKWLRDVIIKLSGVNGVLAFLEEAGRYGLNIAEARAHGLGDAARMAFDELLSMNVFLNVYDYELRLSELPSEPWVRDVNTGNVITILPQLPAYYWVLRVMAGKRSIGVEPSDVIREITENV